MSFRARRLQRGRPSLRGHCRPLPRARRGPGGLETNHPLLLGRARFEESDPDRGARQERAEIHFRPEPGRSVRLPLAKRMARVAGLGQQAIGESSMATVKADVRPIFIALCEMTYNFVW